MPNQSSKDIIDKIFCLAAGFSGSDVLRDDITQDFDRFGDWNRVAGLVDDFMNQQTIQNKNGVNGVAKTIFERVFDREFSITKTEQIIADFKRNGIDSWSELFAFIIADDGEFGKNLDARKADAPKLTVSTPADNSVEVLVGSNIVLTFNETIKAGIGNIEIRSNLGDTRTIAVTDVNQVIFDGSNNTVTINPTDDLNPVETYNVQMASGVITDLAGNAYAGISDPTTLNFNTGETFPPVPIDISPDDNATAVAIGSDFVITFNEAVKAGDGNIVISNNFGDTRTIAVGDVNQVIFDGSNNIVTINPTDDLIPDSTYNVQMANGVITDLAGNAYSGTGDPTVWNFDTVDTLLPMLIRSSPVDNATAVAIGSDIVITFSEVVKAGAGNVEIRSNFGDTRIIAVADVNQVIFDGTDTVTINPTDDLNPDAAYNVQMASGVITDLEGNPYAGISGPTTLNFNTVDTLRPVLTGSGPVDNAVRVAIDSNIVLTFNEPVKRAIEGDFNINILSDPIGFTTNTVAPFPIFDTRKISIMDLGQVAISGNTVTINPTDNLFPDANYFIQVDSGAITDLEDNPYAGISDATTLNSATVDTLPPVLTGSNPVDNAVRVAVDSNIVLTFNEPVKRAIDGDGDINILSDHVIGFIPGTVPIPIFETRIIPVTDLGQVAISGNTVTINPTDNLFSAANYIIQVDSGAITDLSNNPYAGISDSTTLNFSTIDPSPIITPRQEFSYVEALLGPDGGLFGPINDVNDVIGTVDARDDTGVTSFAITSGNDSGYFAIDAAGQLTLTAAGLIAAAPINFELPPNSFALGITATDGARNTSDEELVTVIVENDTSDDIVIVGIDTTDDIVF